MDDASLNQLRDSLLARRQRLLDGEGSVTNGNGGGKRGRRSRGRSLDRSISSWASFASLSLTRRRKKKSSHEDEDDDKDRKKRSKKSKKKDRDDKKKSSRKKHSTKEGRSRSRSGSKVRPSHHKSSSSKPQPSKPDKKKSKKDKSSSKKESGRSPNNSKNNSTEKIPDDNSTLPSRRSWIQNEYGNNDDAEVNMLGSIIGGGRRRRSAEFDGSGKAAYERSKRHGGGGNTEYSISMPDVGAKLMSKMPSFSLKSPLAGSSPNEPHPTASPARPSSSKSDVNFVFYACDENTGCCTFHPEVQLRRRARFGGWKDVLKQCPKCNEMGGGGSGGGGGSIQGSLATKGSKVSQRQKTMMDRSGRSGEGGIGSSSRRMLDTSTRSDVPSRGMSRTRGGRGDPRLTAGKYPTRSTSLSHRRVVPNQPPSQMGRAPTSRQMPRPRQARRRDSSSSSSSSSSSDSSSEEEQPKAKRKQQPMKSNPKGRSSSRPAVPQQRGVSRQRTERDLAAKKQLTETARREPFAKREPSAKVEEARLRRGRTLSPVATKPRSFQQQPPPQQRKFVVKPVDFNAPAVPPPSKSDNLFQRDDGRGGDGPGHRRRMSDTFQFTAKRESTPYSYTPAQSEKIKLDITEKSSTARSSSRPPSQPMQQPVKPITAPSHRRQMSDSHNRNVQNEEPATPYIPTQDNVHSKTSATRSSFNETIEQVPIPKMDDFDDRSTGSNFSDTLGNDDGDHDESDMACGYGAGGKAHNEEGIYGFFREKMTRPSIAEEEEAEKMENKYASAYAPNGTEEHRPGKPSHENEQSASSLQNSDFVLSSSSFNLSTSSFKLEKTPSINVSDDGSKLSVVYERGRGNSFSGTVDTSKVGKLHKRSTSFHCFPSTSAASVGGTQSLRRSLSSERIENPVGKPEEGEKYDLLFAFHVDSFFS